MNRHRFKSDMEAAWELRPMTDITPETKAHVNRFASPKKTEEKKREDKKK